MQYIYSFIDSIRTALNHKLNRDIAWTFVSFAVLAISGILMNILIISFRDPAALGVFNLSYSIYLIGSQVAVMGIHNSVMRYAAYHMGDPIERGKMFSTAVLLTIISGLSCGFTIYLATPLFQSVFSNNEVGQAIGYTGLGLIPFPLNKVLFGYINGMRHMRALAIFQTIRYLTVLISVALISRSNLPFTYASLSFFIAELLTTIVVLIYMKKNSLLTHLYFTKHWLKEHLIFGGKGVLGSIFLDMNTRVDVLMIGIFLNDTAVGVYSFAAMLVDGLQHILSMLRVNFNPLLVSTIRDKDWVQAKKMLHYSKIYVFWGVLLITILVVSGFYILVNNYVTDKSLIEGWKVLIVLFFTYVIISGFTPFDNLLLVSGHPTQQTIQNMTIALVNLALCFVLIPRIGIIGAAISTATSYIIGTLMMLFYSYRLLGWNMLINSTKYD